MNEEYPKKGGSISGHETGWTVEARYSFDKPATIAGRIFDNRWQPVQFDESPIGVPIRKEPMRFGGVGMTLLSYPAAQALRWWLHACAEAENRYCLDTKLVEHKLTYQAKVEAIAEHGLISGEDRSSIKPTP